MGRSKPDVTLVKVIARATGWLEAFVEGRSMAEIARRDGVTDQYVGRILPLALLAPPVVELTSTPSNELVARGINSAIPTARAIRSKGMGISIAG
jgi:hypothetical protein